MLFRSAEWRRFVGELDFPQSVLDRAAVPGAPAVAFSCSMCAGPERPAFASQKALAQHMRIAHGLRSPMRAFAPASGTCSACGVAFRTRLRLLTHLSDSRRPKCREWLLAHGAPLPEAVIASLDEVDKVSRRAAQRAGLSYVAAVLPALAPNGKVVGRVATSAV